jgi:ribosome-dependent ATPase
LDARDQSPESRAFLDQLKGARDYFSTTPPVYSDDSGLTRLQSDDVSMIVEIPPSFGRDLRKGSGPEVLSQVDGAIPFRTETIAQYVRGVHNTLLEDPGSDLEAGPKILLGGEHTCFTMHE